MNLLSQVYTMINILNDFLIAVKRIRKKVGFMGLPKLHISRGYPKVGC